MPVKSYLINKLKHERFRLNGILESERLPSKDKLHLKFRDHIVVRPDELPRGVDLREDLTPVEDQSQLGSCTANALAGAYEYLMMKATGRHTDVSRLFIYYNARTRRQDGQPLSDTGCSMTDAIEALEELGTCLESRWPYELSQANTRPDESAYEEAQNFQIEEALQVNINLVEMKTCLAQGFPFAFGLRLSTSFDKAEKTGIVPMPNSMDRNRQAHGSHALLAVGYSDESDSFIVRNSWGEHWGDKGYCYIPYAYMTDPNLCFDVWSVRKVENDDLGHENWKDDDDVDYRANPQRDDTEDGDNAADESDTEENFFIEEVEEDDDADEESKIETFWSEIKRGGHSSGHSYSYSSFQRTEASSGGSHSFHHEFQNDEDNEPFEDFQQFNRGGPQCKYNNDMPPAGHCRHDLSGSESDDVLYLVGDFPDDD